MATDKTCKLTNGQCMNADCVGDDGSDQQCGVKYIAGRCNPCILHGGTWAPEQTESESGGKYGNGYHCLIGKTGEVDCPTGDDQPHCFDHTDGNKYYNTGSDTKVAQMCWQDADCAGDVRCLPINEGSHIGKTCEDLLSEYSKDRVNCDSDFTLGIKGTGRILPGGDSKTAPGPCQFECKKTPAAPGPSPPGPSPPGPSPKPKPGPTPGPSSTSPKNNKVLIIALVVLGLLTIGGGGFLIYRGYKK